MAMIEGIGDEVVEFVAAVLVVVVAVLAWWSTNARPDRYRTMLVVRSRAPVSVSFRTSPTIPLSAIPDLPENRYLRRILNIRSAASTPNGTGERRSNNARVIPVQEMDSIIDADMAMMNNNRLYFYRRLYVPTTTQAPAEPLATDSSTQEASEPASNEQIREMDSIVSAMEADIATGCCTSPTANDSTAAASSALSTNDGNKPCDEQSDPGQNDSEEINGDATIAVNEEGGQNKILIKLKYLNETLKEVEAGLDELLKDFKWRNFSTELTADSIVRLIFNGRVLDDACTLRACGLHHRAVVHCLVHPRRGRNNEQQHVGSESTEGVAEVAGTTATGAGVTVVAGAGAGGGERAWDLENVLMTLISVALTLVWFFRCEYSNLFTTSASIALLGLTVFYSVAIFGLYLSDSVPFVRTAPAPAPAPAPAQTNT